MIIRDPGALMCQLESVGYYRLCAYWHPFKQPDSPVVGYFDFQDCITISSGEFMGDLFVQNLPDSERDDHPATLAEERVDLRDGVP